MQSRTGYRGTIVCVEDNEDTLGCFPFLFPDHAVEGALTGAAGLALARRLEADLYIVDYRLPDMTGTDICRAIRAAGITTPVLVYSGNDVEREVLAAGADAFLFKGRDPRELQQLAHALMQRAAAASPALRMSSMVLDAAAAY